MKSSHPRHRGRYGQQKNHSSAQPRQMAMATLYHCLSLKFLLRVQRSPCIGRSALFPDTFLISALRTRRASCVLDVSLTKGFSAPRSAPHHGISGPRAQTSPLRFLYCRLFVQRRFGVCSLFRLTSCCSRDVSCCLMQHRHG